MQLRALNVGCFGGGTGPPSLLGGLKQNPWLRVNAVVTMFDSGGSSGQLRDQLGVLPPGDVLKCELALARNEQEARRVLLSRLPTLEHDRLGGHTGGNLLLSIMERYSGDFLSAVDVASSTAGNPLVKRWTATPPSTRDPWSSAMCRPAVKSSKASSGRGRSRGMPGRVWPTRCGVCCRSDCSGRANGAFSSRLPVSPCSDRLPARWALFRRPADRGGRTRLL